MSSIGLHCFENSIAYMTSNLISGGRAASHIMVRESGSVSLCTTIPANFNNNYFWYNAGDGRDGTDDVGLVALGAAGVPDLRGNIIGDSVTCYLSGGAGDYIISTTSPCIDAGVSGTRRDASAITLDYTSSTRALGASADIGCYEAL